MVFDQGQILDVDIDTNDATGFLPVVAANPTRVSANDPGDAPGSPWRISADGSMLWNVDIETIELGIIDASIFVGYEGS